MRCTFEEYLKEPKSLKFEEMSSLHQEIMSEIESDHEAMELYDDLVEKCTAYAAMRATWQYMGHEEKIEQDSLRTSRHNGVIIHFNMLSRYLRMKGKKSYWRDKLGYEEDDALCRKTIGDFSCYIVFVNSICSR